MLIASGAASVDAQRCIFLQKTVDRIIFLFAKCYFIVTLHNCLDKKKTSPKETPNTPSDEDYEGDFVGDYENVEEKSTTARSRKKPSRSRLEVMKIKSTTERNIKEEVEEKVRDPIRIHNPLSIVSKSVSIGGKPTRTRNVAKNTKNKRQRNKTSEKRKQQISGNFYIKIS